LLAPLLAVAWLSACEEAAPARKTKAATTKAVARIELEQLPADGDLSQLLEAEQKRAWADGRTLLVYVGASWCEPCRYFKAALERGELDARFSKLRLLELDRDRDEARLQSAGCMSRMIPLFSRVDAGRCSPTARMEGSIKGAGAVAEMTPRLEALLASP
jgi:thiol-disulfide isomerase/thioredoxin